MRNSLIESRKYISVQKQRAKIGTVTSQRADGGWNIETAKGGNDVAYGTAYVNSVVLYAEGIIQAILKKETLKSYYIA